MPTLRQLLPLILACGGVLSAADGAPAPQIQPMPGPMGGARPAMSPMSSMSSPRQMSLEVELVVLNAGPEGVGDKPGLARWAELAASGYRLAHVVHEGSRQFLYLERMGSGMPGQPPTLPAAVEQDRPLADGLKAKIQAAQAARMPRPMPQPGAPGEGTVRSPSGASITPLPPEAPKSK